MLFPIHIKYILVILAMYFSNINSCYSQQYWQEISYPDSVPVLTILPLSYDTLFIGASSNNAYGGVYRSMDGGESWDFIGLDQWYIYSMLEGSGETIYAGTNLGVYKSENLGDDWEHILPMSKNVISLSKLSPDVLFAGFWGGIMRSLDNGNTWDTSLILHQDAVINSILPISESEVYAGGTSYVVVDGGIFMSDDLGETWENIGLIGYNVQSIAYSPNHELFVGCYYSGLLKSADYGNTWETILQYRDVRSVIINNGEIFIGCDMQNWITGGIFYSDDNGETWEDYTYNITNKHIYQLAITTDNYLFSLSKHEYIGLGPPLNRSVNPVAISEQYSTKKHSIRIYPNPASSCLTIVLYPQFNKERMLHIYIYDLSGYLVSNDSVVISPNKNIIQTDITRITPGMYYIKIVDGEFNYSNKILIY